MRSNPLSPRGYRSWRPFRPGRRLRQPPNMPENPAVTDFDLTHLLRTWAHEPGRINARRITAADGRALLQVRVDLGVLQMEIDGRPDGVRPEGFESLLAQQRDRLARYEAENRSPSGFV